MSNRDLDRRTEVQQQPRAIAGPVAKLVPLAFLDFDSAPLQRELASKVVAAILSRSLAASAPPLEDGKQHKVGQTVNRGRAFPHHVQ